MKHICKNCSNIFNGRKERKFCSRKCQNEWAKGKRFGKGKPKNRKISICLICGKKFEHWAGRKAKYCSRECWSKRNPPVLFYCLNCGKEFWDYKGNRKENVFCSKNCANSFNQRGEKSHWWKGGKTPLSKLLRTRTEYLNWRQKVFERDNYTCQDCGIKSGQGHRVYLQAHHLKEVSKYPKLIYDVSNGITLCKNCHLLRHHHKF